MKTIVDPAMLNVNFAQLQYVEFIGWPFCLEPWVLSHLIENVLVINVKQDLFSTCADMWLQCLVCCLLSIFQRTESDAVTVLLAAIVC